ncbi:hypothetical protein NIES4073_83370 [Kalymmatonema gypsitolerans NIES-4073]|nr:hypothetical protein SAMD00079811_13440 [Scytonema sp. HK-05]BAZ27418.1 hypothetical protein NIES4073_83370 [Scytonema sp. NIES-4073]
MVASILAVLLVQMKCIRPPMKIEAETTQNRSSIIFIVPCEQKLME